MINGFEIDNDLSDHAMIIQDGVLSWNLAAPGTRSGLRCQPEERQLTAGLHSNTGLPVPEKIRSRLNSQIDHLVAKLIEFDGQIEFICLQEVSGISQIQRYFLTQLNAKLASFAQTAKFCFNTGSPLYAQVSGDNFGLLTLFDNTRWANQYYFSAHSNFSTWPEFQNKRALRVCFKSNYNNQPDIMVDNVHLKLHFDPVRNAPDLDKQRNDFNHILNCASTLSCQRILAGDMNLDTSHYSNGTTTYGKACNTLMGGGAPQQVDLIVSPLRPVASVRPTPTFLSSAYANAIQLSAAIRIEETTGDSNLFRVVCRDERLAQSLATKLSEQHICTKQPYRYQPDRTKPAVVGVRLTKNELIQAVNLNLVNSSLLPEHLKNNSTRALSSRNGF